MFSETQRFGLEGEMNVKRWLEEKGYDVHMPADFNRVGCDLVINLGDRAIPVEVKTANKTYRKNKLSDGRITMLERWQWCLHPTNHSEDTVLILVAQDDSGEFPFILPADSLGQRRQVQITRHPLDYRGYLKPYLENTQVIEYLAAKEYKNGGPLLIQ